MLDNLDLILVLLNYSQYKHTVTRKSMLGKPDDLIPFADDIFDTIFIGIRCLKKKSGINANVTIEKAE